MYYRFKRIICTISMVVISQIGFANEKVFSYNTFALSKLQAKKYLYDGVPVLVLSGSNSDMGYQYGFQLKQELSSVLSILKQYYIEQRHLTYYDLVDHSDLLYNRYSSDFQVFLHGVSQGSGLSFSDVKILNAMETLGELLIPYKEQACAFLYLPPIKTTSGAGIIGRNYDYPAPFDQLAKYLTVVILKQPNTVPTAFISIAGEAYCPSCVNAKGIFMSLNNGSPSGGFGVNINTETMLIRMLSTLQNSTGLLNVVDQLNNTQSDFSLIIDAADNQRVLNFEFSTTPTNLGMNYYSPATLEPFTITNFFLNPLWESKIPVPTDDKTWMGVTRRNNLIKLSEQTAKFNIPSFEKLMNTDIESGGAVWGLTIYQIIFDENDYSLYLRIISNRPNNWIQIPLKVLFNDV